MPIRIDLVIVRHGQTEDNRRGVLQGHVDNPLDQQGIIQALKLGRYLSRAKFDRAFSSDLKRARLTAKLVLSQNDSGNDLGLVTVRVLRERNYGVAEGKRLSEVSKMAALANSKIPEFTPDQAENLSQMQERAKVFLKSLFHEVVDKAETTGNEDSNEDDEVELENALNSLGEEEKKKCSSPKKGRLWKKTTADFTCLVVSHGGLIRELLRVICCGSDDKVELNQKRRLFSCPSNTGFTRVVFTMNSGTDFKLEKIYDLHETCHLK